MHEPKQQKLVCSGFHCKAQDEGRTATVIPNILTMEIVLNSRNVLYNYMMALLTKFQILTAIFKEYSSTSFNSGRGRHSFLKEQDSPASSYEQLQTLLGVLIIFFSKEGLNSPQAQH